MKVSFEEWACSSICGHSARDNADGAWAEPTFKTPDASTSDILTVHFHGRRQRSSPQLLFVCQLVKQKNRAQRTGDSSTSVQVCLTYLREGMWCGCVKVCFDHVMVSCRVCMMVLGVPVRSLWSCTRNLSYIGLWRNVARPKLLVGKNLFTGNGGRVWGKRGSRRQ